MCSLVEIVFVSFFSSWHYFSITFQLVLAECTIFNNIFSRRTKTYVHICMYLCVFVVVVAAVAANRAISLMVFFLALMRHCHFFYSPLTRYEIYDFSMAFSSLLCIPSSNDNFRSFHSMWCRCSSSIYPIFYALVYSTPLFHFLSFFIFLFFNLSRSDSSIRRYCALCLPMQVRTSIVYYVARKECVCVLCMRLHGACNNHTVFWSFVIFELL